MSVIDSDCGNKREFKPLTDPNEIVIARVNNAFVKDEFYVNTANNGAAGGDKMAPRHVADRGNKMARENAAQTRGGMAQQSSRPDADRLAAGRRSAQHAGSMAAKNVANNGREVFNRNLEQREDKMVATLPTVFGNESASPVNVHGGATLPQSGASAGKKMDDVKGVAKTAYKKAQEGMTNAAYKMSEEGVANGGDKMDIKGVANATNKMEVKGVANAANKIAEGGVANGGNNMDENGVAKTAYKKAQEGITNAAYKMSEEGVANGGDKMDVKGVANATNKMEVKDVANTLNKMVEEGVANGGNKMDVKGAVNAANNMAEEGAANGGEKMDVKGAVNAANNMAEEGVANGGEKMDVKGVADAANNMAEEGVASGGDEMAPTPQKGHTLSSDGHEASQHADTDSTIEVVELTAGTHVVSWSGEGRVVVMSGPSFPRGCMRACYKLRVILQTVLVGILAACMTCFVVHFMQRYLFEEQ